MPCIVFGKGGGPWLADIADCGTDAVGLDWTIGHRTPPAAWRQGRAAGQPRPGRAVGSPRPSPPKPAGARRLRPHPGHVFNLGHGISQFTPPENVSVLVDTVHSYSRQRCAAGLRAVIR